MKKNIVNVPLHIGEGSQPFRAAYTEKILPALRAFKPELIVLSMGFDAHEDDPLGEMELSYEVRPSHPPTHQPTHLTAHPFICSSIYPPTYPPTYLYRIFGG